MKPPPCIVSLRKKTRNLRRKRRQPYTAILVGAFLMRLESQAVKSRPMRKPFDMDRIKKGSRLESCMTKLVTIAKTKKPVSNVLVPIQPWRSNRATSSVPSSSTTSTTISFSQQSSINAQPPAPQAATRTVKSELCPVTETCTAATMPPSSPSSNRNKNKQAASQQKTGISHFRSDTLANPSTPEGIRKSLCSSPKPITPTIARIKTDPSNMLRNQHTSTSLISPDLQRVRVDIGHTPLLPHQGHLLPNLPNASQHSRMDTSSSPYRDSSSFISPRKRMMLEQETNGSPSKKHRLSTDSGGSGGSSEGVRSGMGSPLLNHHQRVGSPAAGLPYGTSPPRLPQGGPAKPSVSSFSIDSIMSSRTSQDERDSILNTPRSNPIRPVAIPASPMRVNDIKRDHGREEVLQRSRSISGSPPHTPIQPFQRISQSGVSPPPMTTSSIVVPITPYQNRGMDPNTPIDPRLAHLAGLIADPRLGLTPTRGSPFPYSPAGMPGMAALNPYYPYQLAAAASAAGLWTPPPVTATTTNASSNTSSPLDVVTTPVRSTPSSVLHHDKSSTTTSQRGGSTTFSPWGPQMSYRGEPRVSTSSSSVTVSSKATDLSKPDSMSSGNTKY